MKTYSAEDAVVTIEQRVLKGPEPYVHTIKLGLMPEDAKLIQQAAARIESLQAQLAEFELERERGVGAVEAEDYLDFLDLECGSCNRELTEDEIIEMELENGYGSDT